MPRIKNYIKYFLLNIGSFLLPISIRDLLWILYTYIVYILIKSPLNSLIYTVIDTNYIAFLLALMLGLIISILKEKLFNHLFKRIKYDHILNWCLFDILVCFIIIPYRFNVVYMDTWTHISEIGLSSYIPLGNYWATMPEPSNDIKIELAKRHRYLIRRHAMCRRTINYFEPIASAMDRERSDIKHGGLVDVFRDQVNDAKRELADLAKPNSSVVKQYDEYIWMSELNFLDRMSYWTKWF